ncbi:MAG TPA: HNH endonuclease [Vicinamibacterales bacterium]|nr:HNH endonuclease [Vicinamibacterales bacterium]
MTDAYSRACAVTDEHSLPVLEAAHIKPFTKDGPHEVTNGILLRSDLHRLFDRGYVSVTPELKLVVSADLRHHFQNGHSYYPLAGKTVGHRTREADRPNGELLRWHYENVFRK